MDCDDQLDNDKVLDDVGDEQELGTLPKSTWENIIDPTPPFENPIQRTWDPTQEFYVGLLFANKDDLQAAVKHYHIKRNQTFSVKESDPTC